MDSSMPHEYDFLGNQTTEFWQAEMHWKNTIIFQSD